MLEPIKKKSRNYSMFDQMKTETLEDIVLAHYDLEDSDDSDADMLLYILDVIAKRKKEQSPEVFTDEKEAWDRFTKHYLPNINDLPLYDFINQDNDVRCDESSAPIRTNKNRLLRLACIISVIATLLLAGTVTASVLDYNVWRAVAEWTKDIFGFAKTSEEYPVQKTDKNDLQTVLNQHGVVTDLSPRWYPNGYSFNNVDVAASPLRTTFHAVYEKGDEQIMVTITSLSEFIPSTYEKDYEDITVYQTGEIEHYIMTNLERSKIVWVTENYECSITGRFSIEEAMKIIDSIYERN